MVSLLFWTSTRFIPRSSTFQTASAKIRLPSPRNSKEKSDNWPITRWLMIYSLLLKVTSKQFLSIFWDSSNSNIIKSTKSAISKKSNLINPPILSQSITSLKCMDSVVSMSFSLNSPSSKLMFTWKYLTLFCNTTKMHGQFSTKTNLSVVSMYCLCV